MNKYLVIISILVLLVSGCDKISTVGEAGFVMSADITRSIDCGSNYVNLYISYSNLDSNEIVLVAERIPDGMEVVDGSWSTSTPPEIVDNVLIWTFANYPPQNLEGVEITEYIPSSISYQVTGIQTEGSEFRGRLALKEAFEDELIAGDTSCISPSASPSPSPSASPSQDDSYSISTCQGLQDIRNDLGGDYVLLNNIECSGFYFEPIGYADGNYWEDMFGDPFTGTLDGQGYVISNLNINGYNQGTGLFSYTYDATIYDVGLENVDISGYSAVGAVVGYAYGDTVIERVHSTGNVYASDYYAGGLVGLLSGSDIYDSYSHADVSSSGDEVGGLVGYMEQNTCANLFNTYATGDVSGNSKVGGLVGETYSYCEIRYSYATGSVSGNSPVGGLIGLYGSGSDDNPATTVTNSYWYSGSSASCTGDISASDCYPVSSESEFYGSSHSVYSEWDLIDAWQTTGGYPTLI